MDLKPTAGSDMLGEAVQLVAKAGRAVNQHKLRASGLSVAAIGDQPAVSSNELALGLKLAGIDRGKAGKRLPGNPRIAAPSHRRDRPDKAKRIAPGESPVFPGLGKAEQGHASP